jgi:exopolyphosphatase/guanosine-5'-triphosphate,3'-diphosphate pyrophosphatase
LPNRPLHQDTVVGLDIGSNTFSCAEIRKGDQGCGIVLVDDASLPVRLSEGLVLGGKLKPEAIERGLVALKELIHQFDLKNKPLRVAATAVLRKTAFPEDFVRPAEEMLKAPIEIITGEEEAILTCLGAICGIPDSPTWVVMDVGGQSTEVGYKHEGCWRGISLDFGVVSLTERFVHADPPTDREITAVNAEVAAVLRVNLPSTLKGDLLGVAGTATTLGMLSIGAVEWNRDKVHGLAMSLDDVVYWKNQMTACTSKERTEKFRVRPLRADVFPSGICIMEEMIRFLGKDSFTISANGLRIGIAMSLLK